MPSSDPTGQLPETKTEFCLLANRTDEVLITFRRPIRRLQSLGCSARMAMSPQQARDLHRQLGKTLSKYRQVTRARQPAGGDAE